MQKKSSIDWTFGKVFSLILVIIIIILIISGLISGQLVPLLEKTGGKFDEVLILLNKLAGTDDPYETECIYGGTNIEDIGAGLLTLCKTECNISLEEPIGNTIKMNSFRLALGERTFKRDKVDCKFLLKTKDQKEFCEDENIIPLEDLTKVEKEREAYKTLITSFNGALGIGSDEDYESLYKIKDYNKLQDILGFLPNNYLEFKIWSPDKTYRWDGEKWTLFYGRYTTNPESGILEDLENSFINGNKVSWRYKLEENGENDGWKKPLSEELGKSGGGFLAPKPTESAEEFRIWIIRKLNEWDRNLTRQKDGINLLKENPNSVLIYFDGKNLDYKIIKSIIGKYQYQIFYFETAEEKFGLYYDGELHLVKENSNGGFTISEYDEFMSINDEEWEDIKKLNLVYDYLKKRC
ncbi:MAG: hypothetical protein WC494_02980 [Candidatus Pacearchaeota archaeon]